MKSHTYPSDRGVRFVCKQNLEGIISTKVLLKNLLKVPNCIGVLLMVDVWTKYISVEPLRNKNAGVIGAILARFLSNLSYFDVVEISYDNEPVLSAGVKMTQVVRANQGLPTVLQPGKMYSKARTSLAERSIQTVRAQARKMLGGVLGGQDADENP